MPYNPGNVRKLNALGGKRPQATGIAILPKNAGNVLATSEGSVNNYGGNKKMGLYSNVGMTYLFQNTQLTGARINGNMPYFKGGDTTITKPSRKTKNMITVKMLDDGNTQPDFGTKGFVSAPYWRAISGTILNLVAASARLDQQHRDRHMGKVNGKGMLQVGDAKVIALEMWRGTNGGGSFGPVDYSVAPGIHLWTTKPINFSSIVIRGAGVRTHLKPTAVYNKDNLPAAGGAAVGDGNSQVTNSLTAFNGKYYFPANSVFTGLGATGAPAENEIPNTTTVYWFAFPPTTKTVQRVNSAGVTVNVTVPNPVGVNARKIFPRNSYANANDTTLTDISSTLSVYFR